MTDWRSSAGMKLMVDGEVMSKGGVGSAGTGGWLVDRTRRIGATSPVGIGGWWS